jgi:transcriptional regulator GlxA family with amidase domain
VCTGAALLAKAGILDGRKATTNKRAYAWVVSQGPKVEWIAQARWVEDGKFFTSSGVSAGMDMTLGLIARLHGRQASLEAAQGAEYEWHEDSAWDPFAKLNGLA